MTSAFFLDTQVTNSSTAYEVFKNLISLTQEEVWICGLNSLKRTVIVKKVFMGTVDSCNVHPREILLPLIQARASSFLLIHSHPSGCSLPSPEDISFTAKLSSISLLLEIPLKDHIVISKNSYSSFVDLSLKPFS